MQINAATLETVQWLLKKLKLNDHMIQQFQFSVYIWKKKKKKTL